LNSLHRKPQAEPDIPCKRRSATIPCAQKRWIPTDVWRCYCGGDGNCV